MLIKHCPEIVELYITPCNLGFYECNGAGVVALGARVVQDTGQAGALIVSGATVGITPQDYSTGELEAVDLGYPPEWISIRIVKRCLDRVSITATASSTSKTRYTIWE